MQPMMIWPAGPIDRQTTHKTEGMMMPTGYTAAIADGIDFESFVMNCSRAMGALIMMREEPSDAPIPERFEPSDYHQKTAFESLERLNNLRSMSNEETEAAALHDFESLSESIARRNLRSRELRGKYESMLSQVIMWAPPTYDHTGLKKFMMDQIDESIRFDCSGGHHEIQIPQQKTGSEWLEAMIGEAERNIEYHTAEHAIEVERTESRNKWLSDLRMSLTTSAMRMD